MNPFILNVLNVLYKSFENLIVLLPYLLAGTVLSEALKYFSIHNYIKRIKLKSGLLASSISAVVGMVSPLCTFGTVPVVLKLKRFGIPLHVLIVFLISSSMLNPQLFIMTYGGISPDMAFMRVISIFLFCILVGLILRKAPEKFIYKKNVLEKDADGEEACSTKKFELKGYIVNILKTMEYIGFYLLIGVLIGNSLEVFIPNSAVTWLTDKSSIVSMLLLGLLSIPLYACGGGTIPLMDSMIRSGFSKGAVLVFFNVGSATRVTVLAALLTIVKTRALIVYILLLSLFSMVMGYFY
jgi:uncharacterized membrane protein YraQ (UPF0718 family)